MCSSDPPATGEQSGAVALASVAEVDEAVRVATAAQAGWAATPPRPSRKCSAETIVAGAAPADDAADPPAPPTQPGANRAILEDRLADDYQLRIAYQTAQRWLGSK